jgi:hypothetical protein
LKKINFLSQIYNLEDNLNFKCFSAIGPTGMSGYTGHAFIDGFILVISPYAKRSEIYD